MTDRVTIELEGFAEFEEQIKQLGEGYRSDLVAKNTLVKAAKVALEPAFATATSLASYDETNVANIHMRDTIRINARIPNQSDRQSEYVNDTDAAIAVLSVKKSAVSLANEFGTAKMAARPFLIPALKSNMQRIVDALKYELSFTIPEYARKLRKRGIK